MFRRNGYRFAARHDSADPLIHVNARLSPTASVVRAHAREEGPMNARPHPSAAAPEPLELPRTAYDASLLFRHMALLEIDRDELAAEDPLLFRELQAFCTLCRRQRTCASDLANSGRRCRLGVVPLLSERRHARGAGSRAQLQPRRPLPAAAREIDGRSERAAELLSGMVRSADFAGAWRWRLSRRNNETASAVPYDISRPTCRARERRSLRGFGRPNGR